MSTRSHKTTHQKMVDRYHGLTDLFSLLIHLGFNKDILRGIHLHANKMHLIEKIK